jgi:hypothetical protein
MPFVPPPIPSDDSDASSEHSEDSAVLRARQAELRLKDYNEAQSQVVLAAETSHGDAQTAMMQLAQVKKPPPSLPSAAAAFDAVSRPPEFLHPEATRQIPLPGRISCAHDSPSLPHHGSGEEVAPETSVDPRRKKRRRRGGGGKGAGETSMDEEWDVSKMAPKLPGQEKVLPAGVIAAPAVKYAGEDDVVAAQHPTAVQIAMLGGTAMSSKSVAGDERGKATRSMGVEEFLEKGVGGAALPRKKQERKDKEKEKRMKGQSSHAEWKTEAEMALRQQYD